MTETIYTYSHIHIRIHIRKYTYSRNNSSKFDNHRLENDLKVSSRDSEGNSEVLKMDFQQNRFPSGRLGFLGQGGSELGLEFWN